MFPCHDLTLLLLDDSPCSTDRLPKIALQPSNMISVAAKKHCDVRLMLNFFPYMESRLVRLTSACWSRRQEALAAVRYVIFIFIKIHSLWKHEGAAERNRRSPWAEGASQAAHSVCLFGLGDRPCCPKLVSPKNLLERHSCQGIKLVQWCWLCARSHTEMAEGKGSFTAISQLYLTGRSVTGLHINAPFPSLGSYICFRVLKEEVLTFYDTCI